MMRIDLALFVTLLSIVGCLLSPLAGCSLDRWAPLESGSYAVVQSAGPTSEAAAREIRSLRVDRDAHTATFILADGARHTVSLRSLDRAAWPSGCPSNINATRMEVVGITSSSLELANLTFRQPLLVRDCPPDPVRLVLREASESSAEPLGNSLTACVHTEKCVFFEPRSTSSPPYTSIPISGKAYELYSWPTQGSWRFTLMPGTDRLKTYEEVTGAVDGAGTVLTAGSIEDLRIALDQLPRGSTVYWRSAEALEQMGFPPHELALPPQPVISDDDDHGEQHDVIVEVLR